MTAADHLGQQFDVSKLHNAWANDFDETHGRDLPEVLKGDPQISHFRKHGIHEPVDIAAPNPDEPEHQILDGHHRTAVAIEDKHPTIPARVHQPVKQGEGWDYPTFGMRDSVLAWRGFK